MEKQTIDIQAVYSELSKLNTNFGKLEGLIVATAKKTDDHHDEINDINKRLNKLEASAEAQKQAQIAVMQTREDAESKRSRDLNRVTKIITIFCSIVALFMSIFGFLGYKIYLKSNYAAEVSYHANQDAIKADREVDKQDEDS